MSARPVKLKFRAARIRAELIKARDLSMHTARVCRRDGDLGSLVSALVASARESQRHALLWAKS